MCLVKHMEESTVSSIVSSPCACVTVGETHVKYIHKIISDGGWKAGDSADGTE